MLYTPDICPRTERYRFKDEEDGQKMEFRLIYRGSLRSAQSKRCVDEKHRIRKHFHRQLTELWNKEPILKRQITGRFVPAPNRLSGGVVGYVIGVQPPDYILVDSSNPDARPFTEIIADDHARCGFRFVPLVRRKNGFTCALDVLFLRRGHAGELIVSGDLDNRVKTLFDSLKMPRYCSEVRSTPEESENPFFCLLEDDSLVTSLRVTTDRLLTPFENDESDDDVELVIHVTVVDPSALLGSHGLV
jgi:hypothetical protein